MGKNFAIKPTFLLYSLEIKKKISYWFVSTLSKIKNVLVYPQFQ